MMTIKACLDELGEIRHAASVTTGAVLSLQSLKERYAMELEGTVMGSVQQGQKGNHGESTTGHAVRPAGDITLF